MDMITERDEWLLGAAEREVVAQTTRAAKCHGWNCRRSARACVRRATGPAASSASSARCAAKPIFRGAAPAHDNTGSLSKTAALVGALKRVTAALRKLNKPAST
jgi:hypothetical protein